MYLFNTDTAEVALSVLDTMSLYRIVIAFLAVPVTRTSSLVHFPLLPPPYRLFEPQLCCNVPITQGDLCRRGLLYFKIC